MNHYDQLIDRIYAAALEPAAWPEALRLLSRQMAAPRVRLFTPFVGARDGGLAFDVGFSVDADALYRAGGFDQEDPWTAGMVQRGLAYAGCVAIGTDVVPEADLRRTRIWRELLEPLETTQLCCGVVFDHADPSLPTTACSLYRGPRDAPFDDDDRERMRTIVRHLSRAIGVSFRLRDSELKLAAAQQALDSLGTGVILLDAAGGIVFANRAANALIDSGRGLWIRTTDHDLRPRLHADSRDVSSAIERAVARRTDIDERPDHFADCVRVSTAGAHHPVLLQIAPVTASPAIQGPLRDAAAVAFVLDGGKPPLLDRALLKRVFGLTAAEAEIAQALLAGTGARNVAVAVGIEESTVRSHLKAIFSKTRVESQGDLIRLLMSVAAMPAVRSA